MQKQTILLAIAIAVFLVSGCATKRQPRFLVNVDSISSGNSHHKKTYILLPGDKDTCIDDLQYKEYASYVNRALSAQGFQLAESSDEADIAIFLVYGIGDPQEQQYAYSFPTFGQTGVSSSTTYGTLSTYGGYGTYSGTTRYMPTYGITGYRTRIGTYTYYFRYMLLDAYDLDIYRKNKKEVQVWKTEVTSTGTSEDLRLVFPVLVAASKPYIGTNTGQKIKVVLDENDEVVMEVKGITSEQPKRKN